MDDYAKNKIIKFANDKAMNTAVRELIESSILERKGTKDVYILAAERICIDIMKEAWKKLEQFKENGEEDGTKSATPHV